MNAMDLSYPKLGEDELKALAGAREALLQTGD
jgi:hypothetical protein